MLGKNQRLASRFPRQVALGGNRSNSFPRSILLGIIQSVSPLGPASRVISLHWPSCPEGVLVVPGAGQRPEDKGPNSVRRSTIFWAWFPTVSLLPPLPRGGTRIFSPIRSALISSCLVLLGCSCYGIRAGIAISSLVVPVTACLLHNQCTEGGGTPFRFLEMPMKALFFTRTIFHLLSITQQLNLHSVSQMSPHDKPRNSLMIIFYFDRGFLYENFKRFRDHLRGMYDQIKGTTSVENYNE